MYFLKVKRGWLCFSMFCVSLFLRRRGFMFRGFVFRSFVFAVLGFAILRPSRFCVSRFCVRGFVFRGFVFAVFNVDPTLESSFIKKPYLFRPHHPVPAISNLLYAYSRHPPTILPILEYKIAKTRKRSSVVSKVTGAVVSKVGLGM